MWGIAWPFFVAVWAFVFVTFMAFFFGRKDATTFAGRNPFCWRSVRWGLKGVFLLCVGFGGLIVVVSLPFKPHPNLGDNMADRNEILTRMVRGWTTPPDADGRNRLAEVLRSFGDPQLQIMDRAGVRLWPERTGVPPEYAPYVGFSNQPQLPTWVVQYVSRHGETPAAYLPCIRTVVFHRRGDGIVHSLTHELAHAWDDLSNDRVRLRSIDGLPEARGEREIRRLVGEQDRGRTFRSQTMRPGRAGRLTSIQQLYEEFVASLPAHCDQLSPFRGFSSLSCYDRTNAQEFYAEGYAVFHSTQLPNQARLLLLAPSLYDLLECEGELNRVPVMPDRVTVEAEVRRLRP